MRTPKPRIGRIALASATGLALLFAGSWLLIRRTETDGQGPAAAKGGSPARPATGLWFPRRERADEQARPNPAERRARRALQSLPYLGGKASPRSAQVGVVVHRREAAYRGYNLYTSGHGAEAFVLDMEGRLLHRWAYPRDRAFPGRAGHLPWGKYWRRVHLFADGRILAIYDYVGLVHLNAKSRLLWRFGGKAHHDLFVIPDGRVYVLGEALRRGRQPPVGHDFIAVLHPNTGALLDQIWVTDALLRSEYASLVRPEDLEGIPAWYHTNTLTVFDGSLAHHSPRFRKGNILVSLRDVDLVGIIDPRPRRFVWATRGDWDAQHEPVVLGDGHLLLFDNRPEAKRSRVIELQLDTRKILWQYDGRPHGPFFSSICGSNQRLPNGNTLITESDYGRALELTPDKEIVWEFRSPHRAGKQGEYVAIVPEMQRLPPYFPVEAFAARRD